MLFVLRDRAKHAVGDLAQDLRLSGRHHAPDSVGRAENRGVAGGHPLGGLDSRRVGMERHQAAQTPFSSTMSTAHPSAIRGTSSRATLDSVVG